MTRLRLSLAALVAVVALAACTPDEVQFWVDRAQEAEAAGAWCPNAAGGIIAYGLPPEFDVIAWRESRCDPEAVNSSSGALGLVQIMPFWLAALCPAGIACERADLLRGDVNLEAARYVFDRQGFDAWSQTAP